MKEYCVNYKGDNYSNVGYYLLGTRYPDSEIIKIEDSLPFILDNFTVFEEMADSLILKFGNVLFDMIDGNAEFKEVLDDSRTIIFDKASLRANGTKLNKDDISDLILLNGLSRAPFLRFVSSVINLNDNVKKYMSNMPSFMVIKALKTSTDTISLMNLYNMIIFNLPEFEKIINSDNDSFLKNNLGKEGFEITEANKLHQVVGLPKFAVAAIKDLKLEEHVEAIKKLSNVVDGNSLNIILSFLSRSKLIFESEYSGDKRVLRKEKLSSFLMYLTRICERKTYKVTDLLNYFLRQSFYSSTAGYFTFPCNEAMYLSDYLDMCDKYGLKAEKYPSQLRRMHDIVAKNVAALEADSDFVKDEFEMAVKAYMDVEKEISITIPLDGGESETRRYSFIVPRTIKDIVEEGNVLHHCVGSYSNKIINKEARVVFMRDSENVKMPLVTIDIDENYNLVEAKKAFNDDVDATQRKAINKWLKEIK